MENLNEVVASLDGMDSKIGMERKALLERQHNISINVVVEKTEEGNTTLTTDGFSKLKAINS